MDILYEDARILVCIKPAGVVSAGDDEGSMIDLLRKELSDEHACVRSVHRLDAQVSGLMVFARSQAAASILSEQVRTREFEKEYLAAAHGRFGESAGQMEDLLWYNRSLRKSRVMQEPGKDVKRALLSYEVLAYCEDQDVSLVRIRLHTGRTHQIRVQFASRDHALLGDRKYGSGDEDNCPIALWSWRLSFLHPQSGQPVAFSSIPPQNFPWSLFNCSDLTEKHRIF